jgi:hypothetical protein
VVFILPLALSSGLVLVVVSVLLTDYAWTVLLVFCLLAVAICVLGNDWKYSPFYLPFFPVIAVLAFLFCCSQYGNKIM